MVLPGDGVGPEVVDETKKILAWFAKHQGLNFDIQESTDFEIEEEENTLSILNRYIDESESSFDKSIIKYCTSNRWFNCYNWI